MAYVLGIYEIDRAYGGGEEGGWWYDCGQLVRVIATARSRDAAGKMAMRANRLLDHLQRSKRSVSSIAYDGGRHAVIVHQKIAPNFFPEIRPRYE